MGLGAKTRLLLFPLHPLALEEKTNSLSSVWFISKPGSQSLALRYLRFGAPWSQKSQNLNPLLAKRHRAGNFQEWHFLQAAGNDNSGWSNALKISSIVPAYGSYSIVALQY